MHATDGIWRDREPAGGLLRECERPALVASLVLVLTAGAFLLGRRLGGAMEAPLAPLPLTATAAMLTLWAIAFRLRLRFSTLAWLPLAALALFAVACSFPGGGWFDWAVWLAALAASWFAPARRGSPTTATDTATPELVTQQLSRSRTAAGEAVHGTLLAEFAPGERTATLDVAFCPPFERLPEVDAEAADAEVRIVQVLHQGARLEVRRSANAVAAAQIPVEFAAHCRPMHAV